MQLEWISFLIGLSGWLSLTVVQETASIEQRINSLRNGDFVERQRALDALTTMRASPEMLASLREQMCSEGLESRQHAAMALAALGADDQTVIDELLAGMARRSPAIYASQPELARSSMAAMVKVGPKAVPSLIRALEDEQYLGRDLAMAALGEIGPPAHEALPAIEKQLATDDVPEFCLAVEVKWRIDGDAAFAIEKLAPLLDHESGRHCDAAVRTLVHMGAGARHAMPALIAALRKYKDHNLLWAVGELAPFAKDLALPALREAMTQTGLADDAAIKLQNLGEPASELIPSQLKRLKASQPHDGSEPMRIVYTIVIHGPMATPYLREMIALLKHDNPDVRRAAAWGVPRMFGDDSLVLPALRSALEDPESAEEAARSLKMLDQRQQ